MKAHLKILILLLLFNFQNNLQAGNLDITELNREYLSKLAQVEKRLSQAQSTLPIVTVRTNVSFKYPFGKEVHGWRRSDVVNQRTSIKKQLISSLDREEYQGMRSYVNKYFPDNQSIFSRDGVVPADAGNPFDDISIFLQKLHSERGLSRDITIQTKPENAVFRIRPTTGGRERSTTSNSNINGIYRGLYTYSITRAGYKPINETLNLVDEQVSLLDCQLHKTSEAEGPNPCKRQ
ncbi:hypothetical protein [Rheinheimera pleomorphica]|uniref:hypothetical protein n=1 Tax=Rheinheimera pleomorphica TaxID=2703963 RepID=UPI00141DE199|nr:hypothetical protein [Rheinheimera pleomorphica]